MDYFLDNEGGDIPFGVKRSIVPGAPDAWLTALEHFGTMTFAEVVQPAIELCERGFVVYDALHRGIAAASERLAAWPASAKVFLPDGNPVGTGDLLIQSDLAQTFRRMVAAEERSGGGRAIGVRAARDEFYRGDIGKEIVEFIGSQGGFLDERDLADFHSEIEVPPTTNYRGIDVFSCGPWSQGPVIPQVLNILEEFDLTSIGHNTADYIHIFAEALNLVFADRERYYGDPKYIEVPLDELLSKEYARRRAREIDRLSSFGVMPAHGQIPGYEVIPLPVERTAIGVVQEPDTSYVCVVDDQGNAFSATPSDGVGNTPIVPELGLICSGRGSQSRVIPGHPASVAGGKRPRLTPNPEMAFRNGQLYMPFGTPMSDMQPQAMLQTFVNIVDFNMDVQQAIEAPRFGTYSYPATFWPHTYCPGRLNLEGRISSETCDELARRGHDVQWWEPYTELSGRMSAIVVDHDNETLAAGADVRSEAYAAGW